MRKLLIGPALLGATALGGTFSAPHLIPIPESTDGVLLHFRRISA